MPAHTAKIVWLSGRCRPHRRDRSDRQCEYYLGVDMYGLLLPTSANADSGRKHESHDARPEGNIYTDAGSKRVDFDRLRTS